MRFSISGFRRKDVPRWWPIRDVKVTAQLHQDWPLPTPIQYWFWQQVWRALSWILLFWWEDLTKDGDQ